MSEDYPTTLLDFERRFSNEAACREYLAKLRWPAGFVCRKCGGASAWQTDRGRWRCHACRLDTSVMAGTVFQDSKLSLMLWFRAMWFITSQKYGASALGVQRMLGLRSYRSAWALLHKLRHAMVRRGRERLSGIVEVDEAYWGGEEEGVPGRKLVKKALIAVAVEERGKASGRIRLCQIYGADRSSLHGFIRENIEPSSTIRTDGLSAYCRLPDYEHDPKVQGNPKKTKLLPHAHLVVSLLKRWLLGTHQGAIQADYLDYYLDEFAFRFNRRTSQSRGKLFYRLVEQAAQADPLPVDKLTDHH
jgi:transposase-like protein